MQKLRRNCARVKCISGQNLEIYTERGSDIDVNSLATRCAVRCLVSSFHAKGAKILKAVVGESTPRNPTIERLLNALRAAPKLAS